MTSLEVVNNKILDLKKMYIDVSSIMNRNFKDVIKKKKVIICISELSILEMKNEEVYNGIPYEEEVNRILEKAIVLKINDNILKLAKLLVEEGIIPKEQYNDALHISIAKYYRCYNIMYDKEMLKQKNIDFGNI